MSDTGQLSSSAPPRPPDSSDSRSFEHDTEDDDRAPKLQKGEGSFALPAWNPECEPGSTRLGRYLVERRIGRGGMGIVYQAWDEDRGERVALKTMRQRDVRSVADLKREFRIASELTHRNLVTLYELAVEGDVWFFTMECIDGTDLIRYVRRLDSSLPDYERLRDALQQLTLGLSTLHAHGLLHQDIKPSNIVVDDHGRLVLLDFGLASRAGIERDEWGRKVSGWGTRAYLAPERALGAEVSPASDWFSVGAVLYEAMTGQVPPRKSEERLKLVAPEVDFDRLSFGGSMPADLVTLCKRLLASNPARRARESDVVTALGMEALIGVESPPTLPAIERFVGRAAELETLRATYERATQGTTAVVHVRGQSGMGKTALVRHFLRTLDAPSAPLVLQGRCYELESVPYKGLEEVADALARFLCRLDGSTVADLLPPDAHLLGRIFPVLRRVPELECRDDVEEDWHIDPLRLRRRAFRALKALLATLAASRPTIVVIDDLQWGDMDTVHLLAELVAPPPPQHLLVIMVYRSDGGSLLEEISRQREAHPSVHVDLMVEALPQDDARMLALGLLRSRDAGDTSASIAREAAGSPFLIELLVRHAGERGLRSPSLESVLRHELEHLDEAARRLLEVVVVAGRPLAQDVAIRAADVPGDARAALAQLRTRSLVRTMGHLRRSEVDVYHDAIRSGVSALLDEASLRQHHRHLARVLDESAEADPEALARHHQGAGDARAAARYATLAAEAAEEMLAFERAAALYAFAGECDPPDRRAIAIKRAEALGKAGRSGEAAELFQICARQASPSLTRDLQRRAAEQYLVSGRIESGVATLEPVLRGVGLSYPRSPWIATISILKNLALLRLRGHRFTPRASEDIDPEVAARLATCFSAGRGLVSYDPMRGSDYIVRGTLLALRVGDAAHVARGLSYVGLIYVYQGGARSVDHGFMLIEEAERIARRAAHWAALGWVGTVRGLASTSIGAWRASIEEIDESVALMRGKTVGTRWEQTVGLTTALLSLSALGELETMRLRARELEREAAEVGDLFASVEATLYLAQAELAAGQPSRARRYLRDAMARWTHGEFHFQHWIALRHETFCDLYEGATRDTARRLERGWAAARDARLHEHQVVRGETAVLDANIALALLARGDRDRARWTQRIRDAVERLSQEGRAWTDAWSWLLRAGLASQEGDRDGAISALRKAREGFHAADMAVHAAVVSLRLGELLPGRAGDALVDDAIDRLLSQGVAEPRRWCDVYAPRS